MLQSFQHSDFATQFHKTYYLTLMREIFAVMTGKAHTSSKGAKKSCTVIVTDFCITRILQMQCVDPAFFFSLVCLLQRIMLTSPTQILHHMFTSMLNSGLIKAPLLCPSPLPCNNTSSV